MATNLNLDDNLVVEALKLGHHQSKKEAVNEALREYVSYLRRLKAVEAFGTIDFPEDYDPKLLRAGRETG